jgi:cell division protein ZapA (FtsZ GTPase activity inhibitor)
MEGVIDIKQKGKRYSLKCNADIREQLSSAAALNKWVLLSMNLEEDSLENVFQKLTGK